MAGGAYLCYEGVEKLAHKWLHAGGDAAHEAELARMLTDPGMDPVQIERDKVKGAIRTDFVLSAEIIAITLAAVAAATLTTRIGVLVTIALVMTAGVYGLVAAIVKLDDLGLHLQQRASRAAQTAGRAILAAAPWLMRTLSVVGTLAMFLVGGGIIAHGVPALHHASAMLAAVSDPFGWLTPLLFDAALGVIVGGVVLALAALGKRAWSRGVARPR